MRISKSHHPLKGDLQLQKGFTGWTAMSPPTASHWSPHFLLTCVPTITCHKVTKAVQEKKKKNISSIDTQTNSKCPRYITIVLPKVVYEEIASPTQINFFGNFIYFLNTAHRTYDVPSPNYLEQA